MANWIERGEMARAHQFARRIHRMLAGQTYRHTTAGLDDGGDRPSQIETDSERQAKLS
jgi:arginine decarboxylase